MRLWNGKQLNPKMYLWTFAVIVDDYFSYHLAAEGEVLWEFDKCSLLALSAVALAHLQRQCSYLKNVPCFYNHRWRVARQDSLCPKSLWWWLPTPSPPCGDGGFIVSCKSCKARTQRSELLARDVKANPPNFLTPRVFWLALTCRNHNTAN